MTRYELLKHLEWSGPRVQGYYDAKLYPTCLVCDQSCEFGHATDCELDAALKRKTVEVDIPEPEESGRCSAECSQNSGCVECGTERCSLGISRQINWHLVPGPGCPWYEGEDK